MTATRTPRCTSRGCPVRYRSGEDRPCAGHKQDTTTIAERLRAWTATQAAAPGETEGERDGGGWLPSSTRNRQ